jgi:hypothetical protein
VSSRRIWLPAASGPWSPHSHQQRANMVDYLATDTRNLLRDSLFSSRNRKEPLKRHRADRRVSRDLGFKPFFKAAAPSSGADLISRAVSWRMAFCSYVVVGSRSVFR